MKLKSYFEKIIETNRASGSWLITGLDAENKLSEILEIVGRIAIWEDVFILSDREKLSEEIAEKFSVYTPKKNEAQTGIGVGAAKEAIHFLRLSASPSSSRVLIINNAEDLNTLAQNTLLKIVEEPYSNSVIFFLSQTENDLLPTLVSRMRKVEYRPKNYKGYFQSKVSKGEKDFFTEPNENSDFLKKIFLSSDEEKIKFMENMAIWGRDQLLKKYKLEDLQILPDSQNEHSNFTVEKLRKILKILARMKHPAMNHRLQLESLLFKVFNQ